ncbi:MAG: DUF4412 domain-containing protein [Bacteroidota bacterium]
MNINLPLAKTLQRIFCLFLVLLFALPAQAQIPTPRRIKNRVNRNLEERILKKVDEAVDKVLDEVEESAEEAAEEEMNERAENGEGVSGEVENAEVTVVKDNSPYEAIPNDFVGTFKMKMAMSKKGKPAKDGPTYTTFVFDEWRTGMVIESPETEADGVMMIINIKDNTMTTKMESDGKPTAVTMKRPRFKTTVESKYEETEATITPTNDYETINGYRCRKYLVETPDGKGEYWITTDLDMDYFTLMQSMNVMATQKKGDQSTQAANIYGINGFPMRTIFINNDGEEIFMETQYIKPGHVDEKVFDLSGYELMDLSSFGRN